MRDGEAIGPDGRGQAAGRGGGAAAPGPVRLRTLAQIRWVAVVGQAVALLLVHYGLGFTLPIVPALGVVAASALVNLVTSMWRRA